MKNHLKKTNYVVVVDYEEGQTLEECLLLGWSCKYDWFDCETYGDEILTPTGRVKKNSWGLIDINKDVAVYVGETEYDCKDYAESGNREGYNCMVCKLEKDNNDDWILVPVKS